MTRFLGMATKGPSDQRFTLMDYKEQRLWNTRIYRHILTIDLQPNV